MKIDWKKILAVVGGLVILAGTSYLALWLKPAVGPSGVSPVVQNQSSTVVEVDTSGWKIYRNEKYGFEMKYPPSLAAEVGDVSYGGSQGFSVSFVESGKSLSRFSVEVFDVGRVGNIEEAISLAIKTDTKSLDKSVVRVDGLSAYYYRGVPAFWPYDEVFVVKDSKLYGFIRLANEVDFEKILSTFRFVEVDQKDQAMDLSMWRTYQNFKYGFSLKLPPEVKLDDNDEQPPVISFDSDAVMNMEWSYNLEGLSFEEYFSGRGGGDFLSSTKPENITRVIVGGLKATQFAPFDLPYQRFIFVDLEDRFLMFSIFVKGSDRDTREAFFDEIIKTFEFIDPFDVSSWDVYLDVQNAFLFKYSKAVRVEAKKGLPPYEIRFYPAHHYGAVDPVIILKYSGVGLSFEYVDPDYKNLADIILSTFKFTGQ